MENRKKSCKQSECPMVKDGTCLEGLTIESCPHFYWTTENGDNAESQQIEASGQEDFELFKGNDFNITNLNFVTHKFNCRPVILIGESECGKTTLLATLFNLFQNSPFINLHFAGSLSLIGFERRCFDERINSGRAQPYTLKTPLNEDIRFLHISLRSSSEQSKVMHFVFSDIAGEKFKEAGENSNHMINLPVLKQAKLINFIIDGERVADSGKRHSTIFTAEQFIRRALDTGIFDQETELNIITSKFDTLEGLKGFNYENAIVDYFNRKFASRVGKLSFFKIAARPRENHEKFQLGWGLDALLNNWVNLKDAPGNSGLSFDEVPGLRNFQLYKVI